MQSASHLWLFFLMVFGIVVLPGMDMAFVLANAVQGGRRAGLLALAGVMLGAAFQVIAAGLGLGLLLQVVPGLFNAVLLAGAAYLAWIGLTLLRHASAAGMLPTAQAAGRGWPTFRQGVVTNLLNPKAYLFMLAVFPQFMDPAAGLVALQLAVLLAIIWVTQAGVYGSLALAAAGARNGLAERPRVAMWAARGTAAVLIAGAVYTAWTGWKA